MSNPADEYAQNHPYRALGLRFWLPWGAAMAVVIASFPTLVYLTQQHLAQPWRVIVMGMGMGIIAFTLALVGMNRLPHRAAQQRGLVDPPRPAMHRYNRRFMAPMLIYIVALLAATSYWKAAHPTGVLAVAVALAPAIPVLFAIRAMGLWLREETDEYLRAQMLEGWFFAALLAMAICVVLGFLDQFGIIPRMPLYWGLPIWAACFPLAHLLRKGRGA